MGLREQSEVYFFVVVTFCGHIKVRIRMRKHSLSPVGKTHKCKTVTIL